MSAHEFDLMPNNVSNVPLLQVHSFPIDGLCKVTRFPDAPSTLVVMYTPDRWLLEYISMARFVASFRDGKQFGGVFIRDMEQTVQTIARACASALGVRVFVMANIFIKRQQSNISAFGFADNSAIAMPPVAPLEAFNRD